MMNTVIIFPVLAFILIAVSFGLAIFGFLKSSLRSRALVCLIGIPICLLMLLSVSYVGYRFLKPQIAFANEGNRHIKETKKLLSNIKETNEAVDVSIGKFVFRPSASGAFDGEIYNEKGGIPVTLKNTAKFEVSIDVKVIAYDQKGKAFDWMAIGSSGDLEPGETKTIWLFRKIIKESEIEKYKKATYKEDKSYRMTIKMN